MAATFDPNYHAHEGRRVRRGKGNHMWRMDPSVCNTPCAWRVPEPLLDASALSNEGGPRWGGPRGRTSSTMATAFPVNPHTCRLGCTRSAAAGTAAAGPAAGRRAGCTHRAAAGPAARAARRGPARNRSEMPGGAWRRSGVLREAIGAMPRHALERRCPASLGHRLGGPAGQRDLHTRSGSRGSGAALWRAT